ncbi:MAG: 2-oxoglutarate dehydrogenase E1 component [Bacteroidetes bacterium 4572_77]|nr:MAG: 2-oxoglutarate dehydrogenase E1 component [Bacteroidetes bacterium 4572_77]
MENYSYLNNEPAYIEELYEKYLKDPDSLDKAWRQFFEGFEFSRKNYAQEDSVSASEYKVINLIEDYRKRGHLFTQTNPVRTRRSYKPSLHFSNYNLEEKDLEKVFQAGNKLGLGPSKLKDIIAFLEQTYCGSVAVEYVYIRNTEEVSWLKEIMESKRNTPNFTAEQKQSIMYKLTQAVGFEKFIHKRFPGQKRFSLEGAEALIPALESVIEIGVDRAVKEFIIGMPHRGRLNVLANIMKKPYHHIFSEFAGNEYKDEHLLGDVKYHLGYTSERSTVKGFKPTLTLCPNPSHLEAVAPLVTGMSRARIDDERSPIQEENIIPIIIHGDASIAGQGVVYELLQMSGLEGYKTGGSLHLVINNQVGFTTNYLDARTSTYCTDVGKTIQSPIFHVNGDDVEAVTYVIQLALEYRQKFKKDVFIDLLCYRKYGHNEGDEPRFTQPILYKKIENHPNPREIYAKKLLKEKSLSEEKITSMELSFYEHLEHCLQKAKKITTASISSFMEKEWKGIRRALSEDFDYSPDTSVSLDLLQELGRELVKVPSGKKLFRKIVRLQKSREKMLFEDQKLDWAMGELLAYGSMLAQGFPVRISGQDVERGTFSHRHAVFTMEDSAEKYIPLQHISKNQARFSIYNSLLSEYAVLGFEYGYALTAPNDLTIWEAQFGDFSNGAQIIFDQFVSSAEDKWKVMNDLVVLLPHGFEGQGPEHSSARMERYLTLCAENNMQVLNCTTPANIFHAFRRQVQREFRKPLIIFTPKSLLRHPLALSPVSDFTQGGFKEIIDDTKADPSIINKIAFCNGKIYYDLIEAKEKLQDKDSTAIIRIEQLYPMPKVQIEELLKKYNKAQELFWVQEEPYNMGAWPFVKSELDYLFLKVIARPATGSPATGSSKFHKAQQDKIIDKLFDECVDCPRIGTNCYMACIGNKASKIKLEIEKNKTK